MPLLPALLALFLFASAAHSQQASYTYWPVPPSNPFPALSASNTPRIGTSLDLQLRSSFYADLGSSRIWSDSFLMTGASRTAWGSLRLPWTPNLTLYCKGSRATWKNSLLISIDAFSWIPRSNSTYSTIKLPIPNDSSLLGVHFYQQLLIYSVTHVNWPLGSPTCNFFLSRGGHGVIGR